MSAKGRIPSQERIQLIKSRDDINPIVPDLKNCTFLKLISEVGDSGGATALVSNIGFYEVNRACVQSV